MAVRGIHFAVALCRTSRRPSVRFLRTKREVNFDDLEGNDEFEGIYSSNESVEVTRFGAIRRDNQNLPHRHGEFDATKSDKPLLGFDIPLPEGTPREVKERSDLAASESKRREVKGERKSREKTKKLNIQLKTVTRELELDQETLDESHGEKKSAFEAVKAELNKRDQPPPSSTKDSFGFRILKAEIKPMIWKMSTDEVLKCLMRNILFDSRELLVLDKPFGLSMHGSGQLDPNDKMALTSHLDAMAKAFRVEKLYPVHRLDKDVTGVLCIAKNRDIADGVKALFKARQIKKEYVAITRGVPPMPEGVIDDAIAEGTVEGRFRMVIVPKAEPGSNVSLPKFTKTFPAVTKYKIISASRMTAFIRLLPETGYTHQLRVHLGLGLRCPILGDHKYTHLRSMAPQKLPGEMLDRLAVRQQMVRNIPLHLHSRHLVIPGILEGGRDLIVKSSVPTHFKRNLERLKIRF